MKRLSLMLVPALLAATPAYATSSIHCRTANGPDIWLVVPNERGAGVTQARIVIGREELVTGETRGGPWVSRGTVNQRLLSLRVAPGGASGTLLLLNATRRGVPYVGNVTFRGRSWPVRCFWDEDDEE